MLFALRKNPSLATGSMAVMTEIKELCQSFEEQEEAQNESKASGETITEKEEASSSKKTTNKLTKRDED